MEWFEYDNDDKIQLKENWETGGTGEPWELYWEENLFWDGELRDRQRNYKRNGDIVFLEKNKNSASYTEGWFYNTYSYIPTITLNDKGYVIMDWDRREGGIL